jgi:hypothetical protein
MVVILLFFLGFDDVYMIGYGMEAWRSEICMGCIEIAFYALIN